MIHSDNAFATVAYLRIKEAELQPKEVGSISDVIIPPLLEEDFALVQDNLQTGAVLKKSRWSREPRIDREEDIMPSSSRVGNWVSICNIQRTVSHSKEDLSLEEEVTECFEILQGDPGPQFH